MALTIEGIALPDVQDRDSLPTQYLIEIEKTIDTKLHEMYNDKLSTNLLLLGALAGIREELARRQVP